MENKLFYLTNKFYGNSYLIFNALQDTKVWPVQATKQLMQEYHDQDIFHLSIFDDNYPKKLNELDMPPLVLFYKGNIDLLKKPKKYYITDELHSEVTNEFLEENKEKLITNVVLVTNDFAKSEKHLVKFYRENGGKIIHIAKEGLSRLNYSDVDLENELFISQFPNNTHVRRDHFYKANRIACKISDALLILSAKPNSKISYLSELFSFEETPVFALENFVKTDLHNSLLFQSAIKINTIQI
ncbi:DNA-processing protein DprA [Mycoplasma corogypsi]|uniref:DNA-processing protein DprA n=1 Tax=Mycoplasma corogypsi TaxID=2106 RepID=UPI0038734973